MYRIAGTDEKTVEKSTVDYEIDIMRALLNWCRRRGWVRENVADNEHVERLVKVRKNKEKRVFTDDELDKLLALDGQLIPFVFNTLYYTGMRIGELSHLQVPKDVNLNQQEIHIREKALKVPVWNQTIKRNLVREIQWTPKSYEWRIIPIEARLEPILRQFQEQRTDNILGLYFLSERGTQITDHISRQIKSITGKNDVSVHTFRHTHISHALNRWGRHPSVVQRWVGHKDLKTTMQYIHVSAEDLHREALKTGLSG